MAVGTITRVPVDPHGIRAPISIGDIKMSVTNVVGSASYTTGGDALTPANLGLSTTVLFAIVTPVASSGSNNVAVTAAYNTSSQTLQVFSAADSAGAPVSEAASTTNVSGLTFQVVAFGY